MGYHGVTIQINSEEELSFSVKEGPTWNFRDFYTPQNVGEKIGSDLVNVGRNFAFRNFSTHKLLFPRTCSRPFWAAGDCDLFGCI